MVVLSFEMLNNTFKVKWPSNVIRETDIIWNIFPKHVFNGVGGIKLML